MLKVDIKLAACDGSETGSCDVARQCQCHRHAYTCASFSCHDFTHVAVID